MTNRNASAPFKAVRRLRELTARVGSDPLLTQASAGNSSEKRDGVLWIKASGKWMADALDQDIFIPLDLAEVFHDCVMRDVDPADWYPGASVETAMHAVLPHRVVLHVHSVNSIAWAVRQDAPAALEHPFEDLPWQWIPFTASGLPLARAIERALYARPDAGIFILGNHGLVIGGEDPRAVENLLSEVERRLAIRPRPAHPADYAVLEELCHDSDWDLPDDDEIHALATDPSSECILSGGLLYPCQAIFTNSTTPDFFLPIPHPVNESRDQYRGRPFLIVRGRGVLVSRTMPSAELAMLSGLAQVVQRVDPSAPLRYLSESEVASGCSPTSCRYRELANDRLSPELRTT